VAPATIWFLIAFVTTAVFAALATALTTLLRVEPQAFEGEKKGMLARIHEHWSRELAITMVVIPFSAMTASLVFGTFCFKERVGDDIWRLLLLWLALTLLILIAAGLLRAVATRYPATFMRALGWLYVPAFFLLYPINSALGPLLRRLRLTRALDLAGVIVSARDVQDFVEHDGGDDLLKQAEREMISSIIDIRDTPVREVMIPRIDVKALDMETPFAEAREFMVKCGHSRVPVFKDSADHVVGILYSKDLLRYEGREPPAQLIQILRKPYFVPESKKVDDLLRRFQSLRQHMAIVVDEYGGTAGIVTLEDLLEEIVGEIQDEYDKEEQLFELIDDNSARVDAKIDLEELGEILKHEFKEVEEDFETLGGLLFYHSERILRPGDELKLEPFIFRVESVQRQRIAKVIIMREGLAKIVRNARDDGEAEEGR